MVRSEPERTIDDWLYDHGLAHAYEPDVGRYFSDWRVGNVYVEYWGSVGMFGVDKVAAKRAEYAARGFVLLELFPKDVPALDRKLEVLKQASAL